MDKLIKFLFGDWSVDRKSFGRSRFQTFRTSGNLAEAYDTCSNPIGLFTAYQHFVLHIKGFAFLLFFPFPRKEKFTGLERDMFFWVTSQYFEPKS